MSSLDSLLRVLKWNAAFSGFSTALMVVTAPWIASQLGVGGPVVVYVTAGVLVVFAFQLLSIVRTRRIRVAEISGIIAGDVAWVAGSAIFVALRHSSMTTAGLLLVDLVAIVVLCFAVLQIRGLAGLRRDRLGAT